MQAQAAYASTSTQTLQQHWENLTLKLPLRSKARVQATAGLSPLVNIPKIASDWVQKIIRNDLFTPAQKAFAMQWEEHFIQLLNQQNGLLPAKAVCYLGIKVITPALVLYEDNRLASEQLLPCLAAQRDLLILLLPENEDVEKFISNCEDVFHLMIETTMKLEDISRINRESEQLLSQTAANMHETILSNANQSREMLRQLAQQWRSRIGSINIKLTELTEKADVLNKKFQDHSHELEKVGTQLAAEQQVFQGLIDNLKNCLQKV